MTNENVPFGMEPICTRYQVVKPSETCLSEAGDLRWFDYARDALDIGIDVAIDLGHATTEAAPSLVSALSSLASKSKASSSGLELIIPNRRTRSSLSLLIHEHELPVFDTLNLAVFARHSDLSLASRVRLTRERVS